MRRSHTTTWVRQTFLVFLSALIVAATGCGGGGGNVRPSIDGGMPPPPSVAEPFDTVESSLRRTHDGESADRVAEYLRVHASGGPWERGSDDPYYGTPGLVRFESPPTIRLNADMSERERAATLYAVALVNRALPYEWHLQIGAEAAPEVRALNGDELEGHVPDGEIFVQWLDGLEPTPGGNSEPIARAHNLITRTYDTEQKRWEHKVRRSVLVEADSNFFDNRADHVLVSVMVHEILHGLGFAGHVPGAEFADSNMFDAWFRLDGALPAIDASALQALYRRLGAETEPEDLSADSLGAWSRETFRLKGSLDGIEFGVDHFNGITTPWTAGTEPTSGWPEIAGTAKWEGGLLGFTPELRSVGGNAELTVNLGTMDGTAAFTELQSWGAAQPPGILGTGTQWGDGDLHYAITVGGNYLRSTGGDEGTVNGQFYGTGHQGVAGSVERDDLTAAFGANRE